jgi:hypothetical protein
MMHEWSPLATSRYQDHVIAHVLGATALGYFIVADAAYLLLDIALIWTVYTSGEMALMPQAVVISDLEIDESMKAELMEDTERLHRGEVSPLARISPVLAECLISDVKIYAQGERRRVMLDCERSSLCIESLPATGEIYLMTMTGDK